MSTLYARGGVYYIGIPIQPDGWVKRSTGTRNKALASAMARMIDELGPKHRRAWDLLEPVQTGRLSVARLYDAFSVGPSALRSLIQELRDIDLEPEVSRWIASLNDHLAPDTVQHYGTHVRSLIAPSARFPVSRINRAELAQWLTTRKCGKPTKRKYRAAMSSFCGYLIERGIMESNPMLLVKAPKAGPPRMAYLEHYEVFRLVESQIDPFRTISALMHATGMEISAILRITWRDIDTDTWMIRARGTKTQARDRQVYVMEWARKYLARHISDMSPGALVFPGVTRWAPTKSHQKACELLGIRGYTLRDSRHTFAVGATKAGVPAEIIAAQLGHTDTQMVNRIYSRFQPSKAEQAKWFERADQRLQEPAHV